VPVISRASTKPDEYFMMPVCVVHSARIFVIRNLPYGVRGYARRTRLWNYIREPERIVTPYPRTVGPPVPNRECAAARPVASVLYGSTVDRGPAGPSSPPADSPLPRLGNYAWGYPLARSSVASRPPVSRPAVSWAVHPVLDFHCADHMTR
jgi:hypothetical protein